jgi:hypothetical protein
MSHIGIFSTLIVKEAVLNPWSILARLSSNIGILNEITALAVAAPAMRES